MCLSEFRLHTVESRKQNAGKVRVFAPCGHCLACEKKMQYAWAWRLTSEIQYYMKHRGYRAGFLTLTYNNESLPYIPEFGNTPCFDKKHTETFINNIRKHCHREKGLKDIKFLLSSEFGPETRRPHYHLIIAWDGEKYTAEEIHSICRHYWADDLFDKDGKKIRGPYGFICPKNPEGGQSQKSGKVYKPFEIACTADAMNSCFYTAKYVTKDYYFMREILNKVKKEDLKKLRQWLPHHRQSKSLGFESIKYLSDREKLDLLQNGRALLGSDRLMMPPLYIQNKILFAPCYIMQITPKGEPKRLVSRELTDFYKKHLETVLKYKCEYYDILFEKMQDVQYWKNVDLPAELRKPMVDYISWAKINIPMSLGMAYLVYYGMKRNYCFKNPYLTYRNRFLHPNYYDFRGPCQNNVEYCEQINYIRKSLGNPPLVYSSVLLDDLTYSDIQHFFSTLLDGLKFEKGEERDEKLDRLRDILVQPLNQ